MRSWFPLVLSLAFVSTVNASTFEESGKKILYFAESGFGAEGDFGAFSLENPGVPTGTCLWDVILFPQSLAAVMSAAYENDVALGKVVFNIDEETGDCILQSAE